MLGRLKIIKISFEISEKKTTTLLEIEYENYYEKIIEYSNLYCKGLVDIPLLYKVWYIRTNIYSIKVVIEIFISLLKQN